MRRVEHATENVSTQTLLPVHTQAEPTFRQTERVYRECVRYNLSTVLFEALP